MNTKIFLASAFTFITLFSFSQTLYLTARGGVNNSNLIGVETPSYGVKDNVGKAIISPTFGIGINYDINKNFNFGIDFIYSPKGATYSGTLEDTLTKKSTTFTFNDVTNYLEAPIVLSYKFLKPDSKFRPYVSLGFAPSVRISSTQELKTEETVKRTAANKSDTTFTTNQNLYNYNQRNVIDYGLLCGLGFKYNLNKRFILGADARYTFGLIDQRETKLDKPGSTANEAGVKPKYSLTNTNINLFVTLSYRLWDGL
jgi:outer membrane protein W